MKRFVEGQDRRQATLLPECLDDFITKDNPVRAVEVFSVKRQVAERQHKARYENQDLCIERRPLISLHVPDAKD